MKTRIHSPRAEVTIGDDRTVLIGERINPSGRKKLAEAIQRGAFDVIRKEARDQVEAGADILDVNVGEGGMDEVELLPEVLRAVMGEVPVPLCIDSGNPRALEAALKAYGGKALVNSVNGKEASLDTVLPLVKAFGAAVIALPLDEKGIPKEAEARFRIAERIVERCSRAGIPLEDVIVDCLALSVGVDTGAGLVALETIEAIRRAFGVNITVGASNISYGLPERGIINRAFLALALQAGVTCPVVNAAKVRAAVLATDLLLGRDAHALRYIRTYRSKRDLFL